MVGRKRVRDVPLYVWVRPDELDAIRGAWKRRGSAKWPSTAISSMLTFPPSKLVSLQRRCANNLNQVATHANSYGVYQKEIKISAKGLCRFVGAAV